MNYVLAYVRIFTTRWEESVAFYRDALGMECAFANSDLGWAEFPVGGASLALERVDPADPGDRALVGRFVGISLEVQDIHATCERLAAAGVRITSPPTRQGWGGWLAHFEDPDRNTLTLLGRG